MAFLSAALPPASLHALDVFVAPILYVDETEENSRDTIMVQADLLNALWGARTGVILQFGELKNNRINPPASLFDAMTVCRDEEIEYLLYGYVTMRSHSVLAEVRLFDYESRAVVQSFFGMDDTAHYERLIADLARKIILYFGEAFEGVTLEKTEVARLAIPVIVGYWTPIDSGWIEVKLGTVAAGTGLVFVPTDNLFTVRGIPFYLSLGLEAKYRLGLGYPSGYDAYIHTVYLTTPLRLNVSLTPRHHMFFGLGYTYFLEIFLLADKYADTSTYLFHNMGLNAGFGYRFRANETLSLFFRNDFDFLFNERSLITYSPSLGIEIQVYRKEIEKKW